MATAYMIYDVYRCSNETKVEGDPECAEDHAIRKWLQHKKLFMRVLNTKINFESFDDPIR